MDSNPRRSHVARTPIVPERVRAIAKQSFAFLPHRFLREGFFSSLAPEELRLYILLVLAADRYGLSFYHYDTLCALLRVPLETYIEARNNLIRKDLIAFDGTRFQVLSLPEHAPTSATRPLTTDADFEAHDAATVRALILQSLASKDYTRTPR